MPDTTPAKPKPEVGERILRAAAHEFAEEGFAGARVDQIARRAGVNKAMLYYHVGDKAALYERVILDAVSAVESSLREALDRETTHEGKILAVARAFEAVAVAKPHMPRVMLREMAMGGRDLPAPAIEAFGRIIRLEQDILSEAVREGRFKPANVMSLHILIAGGTMLHLVSQGVRDRIRGVALPDLPEPSGSVADAVAEFLLDGIRARHDVRTRTPAVPRADLNRSKTGKHPRKEKRS